MFVIPRRMVEDTFKVFRSCGANKRECKLYWLSSWTEPSSLVEIAHPKHKSNAYGVSIDSEWISSFWMDMSKRNMGVKIQVHTHPNQAFHSLTDDKFPLLFDVSFLSLVIPDFAMGPINFQNAYLAEIQTDGTWAQVEINKRIQVNG